MAKNWGFVTIASVDPTGSDDALAGHLWINDTNGATFAQIDAPQGSNWIAISAGGSASDLAAVLAVGNDTGGLPIINTQANADARTYATDPAIGQTGIADATSIAQDGDFTTAEHDAVVVNGNAYAATLSNAIGGGNASSNIQATADGLGTASADQIVETVDNIASAVATATASGLGGADVRRTATAASGDAHAEATATTAGNGDAFAEGTATSEDGNATAQHTATATGIGNANVGSYANSANGIATASLSASDGSITADWNLGVAGGAPSFSSAIWYSEDANPPPASFATLIYRDTTAVTGGVYAWDGAAYQQISDFV